MDAFAVAAAALAADTTTEAGTFLPAVGPPVPCRLRFARPDPVADLGGTSVRSPGYRIIVFAAGLPAIPTTADRVIARGATFSIRDVERAELGHWAILDGSRV